MRIKAQLIILLTISSLVVSGQNKVRGYVLDKQTNMPLSYAIVSELHQKYGSYSDTTGLFAIFFLSENDTVKVSNIGYKSRDLSIRDLLENSSIYLEPSPLQLSEIVVVPNSRKLKEIEIGNFTKKTNISAATAYPLNIRTVYVPFPENRNLVLIKTIRFIYETAPRNYPLRIRLLEAKPSGEPGNDIISENLVINRFKNGNRQIAEIDISKSKIYMPYDGVFIVFEWIMDKKFQNSTPKEGIPGPYLGAVKSIESSSQWITSYNSAKWRKVQNNIILSAGLTIIDYPKK
jgi:hypothetical protein